LLTCYLQISWDWKALIPANFVLFFLNEGHYRLRVRWHLLGKFQSMEQSIKSFGGSSKKIKLKKKINFSFWGEVGGGKSRCRRRFDLLLLIALYST
jgi:hypothetical protein